MIVYTYKYDGKITEQICDVFGHPNKTACGEVMYENTHFQTELEAIEHGIKEELAGIQFDTRTIERLNGELQGTKASLLSQRANLSALKTLSGRNLETEDTNVAGVIGDDVTVVLREAMVALEMASEAINQAQWPGAHFHVLKALGRLIRTMEENTTE